MGYLSRQGRKPNEYAAKINHSHLINDPEVAAFLQKCKLPDEIDDIDLESLDILHEFQSPESNPIKIVVAVDGGYTEVNVRSKFPSAKMAFFQFGAMFFTLSEYEALGEVPFIFPSQMAKFRDLERIKLIIPTQNIGYDEQAGFIRSVRKAIYDFFAQDREGDTYLDTLRWLIYSEYHAPKPVHQLASCPNPNCSERRLMLRRQEMSDRFSFQCPTCQEEIFLSDFFRLHEAIDEELGAGGILGYLTNLIEQIIIAHTIKNLLAKQPQILSHTLFLKDGPLAFFGQTANMHKIFRRLCKYLLKNHNLYITGLEKSGAFVDHAHEIGSEKELGTSTSILPKSSYLLLNNDYIYRHIIPGQADPENPYGGTSYYSGKLIFKSEVGDLYVLSIPTSDAEVILHPKPQDFANLPVILDNLQKLRCDMYENSLVPIALANKVVSLANHPSQVLLEKFSREQVK